MTLQFKNTGSQLQVIPVLVELFNQYLLAHVANSSIKEHIKNDGALPAEFIDPLLRFDVNKIDRELDEVTYDKFNYVGSNTIKEKLDTYGLFEHFLVLSRESYIKEKNIKEYDPILSKPSRIASPGPEAYQYVGWNNLDIKEGKSSYTTPFE